MNSQEVVAAVADTRRVLVLAPSLRGASGRTVRRDLLADRGDAVLYLSLSRSPDDIVDAWHENGELPERLVVVTTDAEGGVDEDGVAVETVSSPQDLTGMGIAVTKALDGFGDTSPTVCLDSLTILLQYVDARRAFRFLHVLSKYLRQADATIHAHLDPTTQDDQTVATLSSLFDAAVRYDAETDEWSVR